MIDGKLVIDGNPGCAKRNDDDWEGAVALVSVERFIFDPESATEARLEVWVDADVPGDTFATSVELTHGDIVALRDHLSSLSGD